ncbi:MAG: hypothetical protein KH366_07550 [Clostridiaceae bacterium]|nr:hypothetical protein [Clostridiaceae bacterium]
MKQTYRKALYFSIPVLGVLFCLWYIKTATFDIVYTDYIRLVNSYLPDVWNPDKFFVPDVLTRIPVNYLARIINVTFFGYRTTFDMGLGVLGLGLAAVVFACFSLRRSVSAPWFLIMMAVMFSLNKWEMLTNGSGWAHFLAIGCFYYHYMVIDRVWSGEEKRADRALLMVLPWIITLGIAGPYCAIYSVTLMLTYLCLYILEWKGKRKKKDNRYILYLISALIPLLLYMWSNSYAVEDHADAVNISIGEALGMDPAFPVRFLIKSCSSMVFGEEVLNSWIRPEPPKAPVLPGWTVYALGIAVILCYLFALWLNFRYRLYEKTVLPCMLIAAGGMNHLLILVSRWIFLKDEYGMSSRYALQYQVGILGIILTIALLWKKINGNAVKAAAALCCLIFLAGNICTTYKEMKKAPYREEYGERIGAAAMQFETLSDEELKGIFDYRKSREDSGRKVRSALEILKEQKWNVFREP